jgi:hypothetical protein
MLLSELERKIFPVENSLLVLDLILLVMKSYLSNENLSLKQIFLSLEYSDNGIRKKIRKLIKDDWLKIIAYKKDKRIKLIFPTNKLLISFEKYIDFFDSTNLL